MSVTKEQLLSWAVQNVKVWPKAVTAELIGAPAGVTWCHDTAAKYPYLWTLDGKHVVMAGDWEAGRLACGILSSDHKASGSEFQPFVSMEDAQPSPAPTTAAHILQQGVDALSNRAAERDLADGERSMARCVKAFNVMFGHQITEEQGWQFMELLKMARAAGGAYREDDYVDGAAYAALAGEAAAKVRGGTQ